MAREPKKPAAKTQPKPEVTAPEKQAAQMLTIDGVDYDFAAMPPARQEIVRQMLELGQSIQITQQRLNEDQTRQQRLMTMFKADVEAAAGAN